MSRKTKRHINKTGSQMTDENQNMEMSGSSTDIGTTAKETLDSVVGTVNNNKLLIGSIAAGCGAAIFLLATDSGRRVRDEIQTRSVDLYDLVSEQVSNGWSQVRDFAQNMLSGEEVEKTSSKIRRVA